MMRSHLLIFPIALLLYLGSPITTLAETRHSTISPSVKALLSQSSSFNTITPSPVGGSFSEIFNQHHHTQKSAYRLSSTEQYLSFSYEGSQGLIGLSGGYLAPLEFGSHPKLAGDTKISDLYFGIDLTHSLQVNQDVILGLRAGVAYLQDLTDHLYEPTVSFLLLLPVEINKEVTIIPTLHWSKNLSQEAASATADELNEAVSNDKQDSSSFYGGLSISFSY